MVWFLFFVAVLVIAAIDAAESSPPIERSRREYRGWDG